MISILVLADSGFGKTTSLLPIQSETVNIKGLNPEETFLITATAKPLPAKGANSLYPVTEPDKLKSGRRIISNNGKIIANVLKELTNSPFKNIVIDD